MAVYDRDADAATAVAAFLTDFSISAGGDVRHAANSNTYHVWWLHRALQKKAWDFAVSGDDYINLAKPNPSTSEALGTIITLNDHTTNYSVRYNIDDTAAEFLFGGSVEQYNGSSQIERYSGLQVLGSVNLGTTQLQIIQNGSIYTSFWGTGLNQTDASTLLRVLIKTYSAGAAIDNSIVVVKSSEWFDTYAIWVTTLGLGEKVAAINTQGDPQNTTALATVQTWDTDETTLEGYQQIDVDGLGADDFVGAFDYSRTGQSGSASAKKKEGYEFVKSLLVRGTSATIFGIDGDLWTGRVYDVTVSGGGSAGTWVQNESLSWSGGTGTLMAVDDTDDSATTRIILHLDTGVAPTTQTISGATASNTATTSVSVPTYPSYLGQFTGSNWIGAKGVGFLANQLTYGDSVTSLDGETPTVPQNVTVAVNITCDASDEPHVFLAEKDAVLTAPDYTTNTVGSGNNSSDPDFVVQTAIPSDTPQDGWFGVLDTTGGATAYEFYHYSSWSGSTFTLDSTDHPGGLTTTYTAGDPVFTAILYTYDSGGGASQGVSNSYVYSADKDVIGWVRHGDPAAPDKPVPISGTVTSAGLSINVVLENES